MFKLLIAGIVFAAWKTGALAKLGFTIGSPISLYTLTDADVEEIASHYTDGRSTFQVAGMSLGDALRLAIRTHRIAAYNTDSYCGWSGQPTANPGGDAAVGAMAAGTVVSADSIAASVTSLFGQTVSAIPVIGAIASIGSAIFGFIGRHHAAAVAKENKILCALVPALDGQWIAMDQGLSSGKLDGPTGQSAILAIQQQAHQVINEDRSSGALDAIGQQTDAITEAYELVLVKSGLIAQSQVQVTGPPPGTISSLTPAQQRVFAIFGING